MGWFGRTTLSDRQERAVEKTLSDLGLNHIPRLLVLNKIDRLEANDAKALCKRYHAVAISALRPETLPALIACLDRSLDDRKIIGNGLDTDPIKPSVVMLENAAGS